jgi:Mrp family chromosome partitioning ATPase
MTGRLCACDGAGKILPVKYLPNMDVVSIETLTGGSDAATIWRGPLKGAAIRQFIADIEWGRLDYLIIDSPPGTGDEPLTVARTIPDAKALIVTTPQEIALADVRKSIHFCRQVAMDILGLVENMSGLKCPCCGTVIDLFKSNGGLATARKENLRFLGCLPLEPEVVQNGDVGRMPLLEEGELDFTRALLTIVDGIEGIGGAQPNVARKNAPERVSY